MLHMRMGEDISKREMMHLHGLLLEVYNQAEEWGENIELDNYETVNVGAVAIHRPKKEHKNALETLSTELTEAIETRAVVPAGD